jgi:hypothetical protein
VPEFALTYERRARKVPAGDWLYARYATARRLDRIEGALIACSVEVKRSQRRVGHPRRM